jgi:hypothetical protein
LFRKLTISQDVAPKANVRYQFKESMNAINMLEAIVSTTEGECPGRGAAQFLVHPLQHGAATNGYYYGYSVCRLSVLPTATRAFNHLIMLRQIRSHVQSPKLLKHVGKGQLRAGNEPSASTKGTDFD